MLFQTPTARDETCIDQDTGDDMTRKVGRKKKVAHLLAEIIFVDRGEIRIDEQSRRSPSAMRHQPGSRVC